MCALTLMLVVVLVFLCMFFFGGHSGFNRFIF